MKAIKKIDNYKRIRIPVEFQNHLGWKVDDEIEVEVSGNEIILRKHENVSELNVDDQRSLKIETKEPLEFSNDGNEEDNYVEQSKEEDKEPTLKEDLTKIDSIHTKLNKPPSIKEYFKINSFEELHEESKPKIDLLDTKDELNNQLCPRCRKPIEDSRFKLSGKYICRDCRNIIRDKMILDIYNKKGDLK